MYPTKTISPPKTTNPNSFSVADLSIQDADGAMAIEQHGAESSPMDQSEHHSEQSAFAHLAPSIVAIDGPAASGKSTVGHQLAALTGFLYFDTGVMYRAITWGVLNASIDPAVGEEVGNFATHADIDILPPAAGDGDGANDGRANTIMVDGHDITWQIRTPEVDQNVSMVAANGMVREALTDQQRRIALRYGLGNATQPGVIMIGRDMGTVVVPESPLKIYLDATAEVRARRRYEEQLSRGKSADYEQILADIYRRDQIDSERTLAPLRAADDAIILDTSTLEIEEVVQRILLLGMQ